MNQVCYLEYQPDYKEQSGCESIRIKAEWIAVQRPEALDNYEWINQLSTVT